VIREFGADVIALQEVDRRFGRRGGSISWRSSVKQECAFWRERL
jgi:endonuclease/exonuclease/phosphatase family metal-dependent hydrolase